MAKGEGQFFPPGNCPLIYSFHKVIARKVQLTTGMTDGRVISMRRWKVLSLLVPKEYSEAISNFVIERGATGVEEVEEDSNRQRLRTYFLQNGREKGILQALHRYLESLKSIDPRLSPVQIEMTSLPEEDWSENWKRFFKPLRVGRRLLIKPPWARVRLKKDEILIEITPGMAFGTGTHATTRLCMEALEKRIKSEAQSVLDVGTGSGILAIAAARLGAREVWGVDVDPVAVEIAGKNIKQNRVSEKVRIREGRIGNIRKKFDIIVANLDFKNLWRMRNSLANHLKKKGILILSGILKEEEEKILQRYSEKGLLRWIETEQEDEWACFTFLKK